MSLNIKVMHQVVFKICKRHFTFIDYFNFYLVLCYIIFFSLTSYIDFMKDFISWWDHHAILIKPNEHCVIQLTMFKNILDKMWTNLKKCQWYFSKTNNCFLLRVFILFLKEVIASFPASTSYTCLVPFKYKPWWNKI